MYVTIAPGSTDLPVMHHQYLYAIGTYKYVNGGSFWWRVRDIDYLPSQALGTSATLSTISNNRGGVT